ncbi:MAG TPA: hypothetical protein VD968_05675 [Pyrinomonadaceae bacterium]|nr:hypothetical protein [Pyrinomonadaceae bacterium]
MPLAVELALSVVSLSVLCLFSAPSAGAAVFRDRASFEAASQNLHTLDFESVGRFDYWRGDTIDGLHFFNTGFSVTVGTWQGAQSKALIAQGVPEITYLRVELPPGTTAVGLDQFSRPMEVMTSAGEKAFMAQGDGSNFVGFVSEAPMAWLAVTLTEPEPTPPAVLDNLTYGQRRAGNEPPGPLLLTYGATGRAAAFESVGLTPEPFAVETPATHNLSADGRTRVTLLVAGVRLDAPGEEAFVTARAVGSQQRVFDLPVESVGRAKNLTWLSQVTVRLPDELSGAGDVSVSVTVRGVESNKVTLRVD